MGQEKCSSFQTQNARCTIQRPERGAHLGKAGICGIHLIHQMPTPLPETRSWTTLNVNVLSYVRNLLSEILSID